MFSYIILCILIFYYIYYIITSYINQVRPNTNSSSLTMADELTKEFESHSHAVVRITINQSMNDSMNEWMNEWMNDLIDFYGQIVIESNNYYSKCVLMILITIS